MERDSFGDWCDVLWAVRAVGMAKVHLPVWTGPDLNLSDFLSPEVSLWLRGAMQRCLAVGLRGAEPCCFVMATSLRVVVSSSIVPSPVPSSCTAADSLFEGQRVRCDSALLGLRHPTLLHHTVWVWTFFVFFSRRLLVKGLMGRWGGAGTRPELLDQCVAPSSLLTCFFSEQRSHRNFFHIYYLRVISSSSSPSSL